MYMNDVSVKNTEIIVVNDGVSSLPPYFSQQNLENL
jgi:hypothetical protein